MSEQAQKEVIGVSADPNTRLTEPFTAEEQLKVRGELERDASGVNGKHEATEKRQGILGKLGLRKASETPKLPADTGHELPPETNPEDPGLEGRLAEYEASAKSPDDARQEAIAKEFEDSNSDKSEAA